LPAKPGVIIRKGGRQATFLPQVWEELPDAEDFMSQLCMKAGLAPDAWHEEGMQFMTYGVTSFEEKH
jgi:AMMECR1 domain-containing protein